MSIDIIRSDGELIAQYAREGSHAAFGELVSRHIDLVYATALRQVRDPHLAQDVSQEVFIVLARRGAAMDGRIPLPVWLYKAAIHASRNMLKSAQRRRHYEMSAHDPAGEVVEAPSDDFDDALPLLDEAIESLGERDRATVILRYFQGESLQETGAALGLSVNATSKRLERIVEKLRRFFHRRNIVIGSGALALFLGAQGATAAPAHLTSSVTAGAIGAATSAMAASGGATVAHGATALAASMKVKAIVVGVLLLLMAGGTGLVLQYRGSHPSAPFHENALPVADTQIVAAAPGTTGTPVPGAGTALVAPKAKPAPTGNFPDYIRGGRIPVLMSPRFKVPRIVWATIQAEHFDMQEGTEVQAPGLTSLDEGDFVRYSGMDFGKGGSSFIARVAAPKEEAGKKIEVRVDDPAGLVIATLKVADTGGWNQWTVQSTPLTEDLAGVHDVYLTFAGGKNVANLDWFKFGGGPRDALARIEAESYDDAEGIQDQGAFISNFDVDDYLRYNKVDFGKEGPKWFHAMCGCRKQYAGGKVEVRLDRFDGKMIAELTVRDTGAHTNHEIQSVKTAEVTGIHDIFVVGRNNAVCDLDWFTFSKAAEMKAEEHPAAAQPQGQGETRRPGNLIGQ